MSVNGTGRRGVALSSGTALILATAAFPASTAWTQLVASTSEPVYIVHAFSYTTGSWTMDIGIGGAGSETQIASFQFQSGTFQYIFALTIPIRVSSGTRIVMRSSTTSPAGYTGGIAYTPERLVI